jgi:predicted enzyme related to lactoylglutathione lyase
VSTVETTVGRFVWHEQVSADPERAQEFYTQLFGWGTEVFKPGEVDYAMISAGGRTHGGFGKAGEGAPPPHWLNHVRVDDLDATIEKVRDAGGKLAAGPFEMGEVGRFGIVTDPQGAFVSLYEPEGESSGVSDVFVWDELGTTDAEAAQRFYGDVFGWTAIDMGEEYGGYRIFQIEETRVAGLMANPDPSIPAAWTPYVAVDDADATTARAMELGGSAIVEPIDIPNVGRFAVLCDPQGAAFGILRPEPAS